MIRVGDVRITLYVVHYTYTLFLIHHVVRYSVFFVSFVPSRLTLRCFPRLGFLFAPLLGYLLLPVSLARSLGGSSSSTSRLSKSR